MDEYTIAIHEAGHACVSILTGRRLESVTIIPNNNSLGTCFNGDDNLDESMDDVTNGLIILRGILILLAGVAAEAVMLNISPKDSRGKDDYDKAREIIEKPNDGFDKVRWDDATKRVFDIVKNPLVQRKIKAVADALMEHKTLTGEQVKKIMEKVA